MDLEKRGKYMLKKLRKWIDRMFSKIFYEWMERRQDEEDIQQYKDYADEYEDFFDVNKEGKAITKR